MSTEINIKDLDKVELLKKLYQNQVKSTYFILSGKPLPKFDDELATKVVDKYIDYFCGKAIKTNLCGDIVDTYLYDRDAGKGTFLKIVNSMKVNLFLIM